MTLDRWLPADRQRPPKHKAPAAAPRETWRMNSLRKLWNGAADETSRRMVDRMALEWFGCKYTEIENKKQNESSMNGV